MACSQPCPPDTIGTSSSTPSTSTSTSTTEHRHIYDVFINHRGPDVKKTFASHLYHRLLSSGLRVFLDQEELQQGENLTSQIQGAIATASVHVAIFSRGYAESNWCLDELVLMLNSGTPIIPVFYGVKPAELRWTQSKDRVYGNLLRTLVWWPLGIHDMFAKIRRILGWWTRRKDGTYEHALLNLGKKKTFDPTTNNEKPRYEANTIENWRKALSCVAEISGFELEACNSDEGRLLNKVVEQVQRKVRKTPLNVATYPTGLKEKLEDLDKMVSLQQQSGGAQVVGIVGLGGIGKTTLAKEFFNSRRTSYSASCFLFDVREAAGKGSLPSLQTELVRCLKQLDLFRVVQSIDEGIGLLKWHLSSSRALIILDDVDHPSQLEALFLPVKDILLPGSLIVVTSRDKDLLTVSGIVESSIYKITGLNRRHSLELFCSHAFNQPYPFVGFEEVVAQFLHACEGLPLSLKVIGALLRGKEDLEYWKYQLSKISKVLPSDIQSRLKISYDSLDEEEKEIFLDIACFFVGQDRDMVIRIWEGSLGIRNLENKCLVQVDSGNRIRMHDHIRDMGRSLAVKEPPGYLRRLWRPIDNLTLQNVPHQSSVRGICIVQRNSESSVELNRSVVDMSKLQLLRAEGDCLQSIFSQGRSPDLIWLCWDKCPYPFLPSWLPIRKLRVLQMTGFLGEITEPLQSFWQSESQLPLELRELSFQGHLSKLPDSIGQLKQLEKIEVRGGRMIFLPNSFGNLTNLQYLDLSWSRRLQELPDSFGNLIQLEHLRLAGCSELSISQGTLGNITTLVSLDLSFCLQMNELPPQVARQRFLKELNLLGTSLRVLTRDIGELGRLETLKLGSPSVKMLPPSLGDLTSLKELVLDECMELKCLPESVGELTSLKELTLYGCKKLKCLPESVGELTSLKELTLSECTSLECLPESVGELKQLTRLNISGSLIKYLPIGITEMNNLEYLNIHSTPLLNAPFAKKIVTGTEISKCLVGLEYLNLHRTRISELSFPEGISPNLQFVKIKKCNNLLAVRALPSSVLRIEMLSCSALREIGGLPGLAKLRVLDIVDCSAIKELPSLETLTSLEELRAIDCMALKSIRGLAQLGKLRLIHVEDCDEIKELAGVEYLRSLKEYKDSGCPKLQAGGGVLEKVRARLNEPRFKWRGRHHIKALGGGRRRRLPVKLHASGFITGKGYMCDDYASEEEYECPNIFSGVFFRGIGCDDFASEGAYEYEGDTSNSPYAPTAGAIS